MRPFKEFLGSLLFIKILLKTAQLFSKHFPPGLLFLSFISFFMMVRIPHPRVHHLVYVFPFFFCFHKCFNIFDLRKNLLTNKFFHWSMCFFTFLLLPWRKGVVGFSLKYNNLMRLKTKRFLLVLTDNHKEICEIIFSAIKKKESSRLCS